MSGKTIKQKLRYFLGGLEYTALAKSIPDKQYISIEYFLRTRKVMHWDNPSSFNEKLNWMKVYDRNPLYTKLADKQEVKEYVTEKIGPGHVIPSLHIYNNFEEIDFDSLPMQFVLKTTHDSGG